MLIALEKRQVSKQSMDAIPTAPKISELIKNVRLRQDASDLEQMRKSTSTFDIDLYFLVLELFGKYAPKTKTLFLSQLKLFLENH